MISGIEVYFRGLRGMFLHPLGFSILRGWILRGPCFSNKNVTSIRGRLKYISGGYVVCVCPPSYFRFCGDPAFPKTMCPSPAECATNIVFEAGGKEYSLAVLGNVAKYHCSCLRISFNIWNNSNLNSDSSSPGHKLS